MSHYVELIGTPGAGKSTIFKKLEEKWKSSHSWIPQKYLLPSKPKRWKFLSFLRKSNPKIDTQAMREAADRFIAKYPEYMDRCWNNINIRQKKHCNNLDLRFDKTNYLYKLIQKIQIVEESNSLKTAVIDEGLIHSIYNSLYWSETEEEERKEIKNVLETIPLPKGIVYVKTSFCENIKRLLERKKTNAPHKSLIISDLEDLIRKDREKRTLVIDIIKEYNISVLLIDSTEDPENTSGEIMQFLDYISILK